MIALVLLGQAASAVQPITPDDLRKQIEFSRLCSANGRAVFLDLKKGPNLPDIELRVPKQKAIFDHGKVTAATLLTSGDTRLMVEVAGQSNNKPATLKMKILPVKAGSMNVSFDWQVGSARPVPFTCIPVPPQVPERTK